MNSENESQNSGVEVSINMSGSYDNVLSKLTDAEDRSERLEPFISDITRLLETVQRTGGGTRSALAEEFTPIAAEDLEPEAVSATLNVLERYDLVKLDGNTWKPGPALASQD